MNRCRKVKLRLSCIEVEGENVLAPSFGAYKKYQYLNINNSSIIKFTNMKTT